jgi:hypothetical protein
LFPGLDQNITAGLRSSIAFRVHADPRGDHHHMVGRCATYMVPKALEHGDGWFYEVCAPVFVSSRLLLRAFAT